jgi:molecular chaperone HscA
LAADAALLSEQERADIAALIDAVRGQAQGTDHLAIKAAVDALAHGTEEFAARRMDRSVHDALTGKTLDQVS